MENTISNFSDIALPFELLQGQEGVRNCHFPFVIHLNVYTATVPFPKSPVGPHHTNFVALLLHI